jgi:hypothetical protein
MDTASSAAPPNAPRDAPATDKAKRGASWSAAPVMLSDGVGVGVFGSF